MERPVLAFFGLFFFTWRGDGRGNRARTRFARVHAAQTTAPLPRRAGLESMLSLSTGEV